VIRLTADAAASTKNSGELTATYVHEWMHYFQFSVTSIGALLSQYRRECFRALLNSFADDVKEAASQEEFVRRLELFKMNWEAWPSGWHLGTNGVSQTVSEASLRPDGLHVRLDHPNIWYTPVIGAHALFEAWAWCGTLLLFPDDAHLKVPKTADSLMYTWPLWAIGDSTDRSIDSLNIQDVIRIMPIMFVVSFYDYRILSCTGRQIPTSFKDLVSELERRKVTVGRLIYQFFRDYTRYWSRPPSLPGIDAYLTDIGLPALSTMLDYTQEILQRSVEVAGNQLAEDLAKQEKAGMISVNRWASAAEFDILKVSADSLSTVRHDIENVLAAPYVVGRKIAPPVCAIETPMGYDWATIGFGALSESKWSGQHNSRNLLRQQLSILEHVLVQHAFGSHLACYGSPDWQLPINHCPHTQNCMGLSERRGIQFCIDPSWRQKVAAIVVGIGNAQQIELSDSVVPGIMEAARELEATLRGASVPFDQAAIDLEQLGIPDSSAEPPV